MTGACPAEDVLAQQARQGVHRVGGGQQRALALAGQPQGGGAGHDGLAHAALAAEEDVLAGRAARQNCRMLVVMASAMPLTRTDTSATCSIMGRPVMSRSNSGTGASTWSPKVSRIFARYLLLHLQAVAEKLGDLLAAQALAAARG